MAAMEEDSVGAAQERARRVNRPDIDDKTEFETSEDVTVCSSFDGMGLNEDLLRGIYNFGFQKPSAIQQRAIIPITKKRDVIAQAQSGINSPFTLLTAQVLVKLPHFVLVFFKTWTLLSVMYKH